MDSLEMTQAQYAEYRGVSRQAVNKAVKAGKIKLNDEGLINAADADYALDGNRERVSVRPEQSAPGFDGGHSARLTQAKVGTELYRARMAQLEYEERIGKLLRLDDVKASMEHCAEVMARDIDRLPALTDELAAAFTREGVKGLRAALKRAADDLRRQLAASMVLVKQEAEDEQEAA